MVFLRNVMIDSSPDPIVAAACREAGRVLVTHNIKHFRQIAKDYAVTRAETERLCRIELGCRQIEALPRMRDALSVIEGEWARLGSTKRGLRIFIGDGMIRLHR